MELDTFRAALNRSTFPGLKLLWSLFLGKPRLPASMPSPTHPELP
jgi:hypothetical protein